MNTELLLRVTEIQRFCMHDGNGIRTVVFLKGCPLRCAWCHNPETQKRGSELLFYSKKCIYCSACLLCENSVHGFSDSGHTVEREKCISCGKCANICPSGALELCGKELSIGEIIAEAEKDKAFYGAEGGITLSGGEPFFQGEKTVELLRALKQQGFNTAVETSGFCDRKLIEASVEYTDMFLWDIKDTDSERHRRYTGVSNEKILENLFFADSLGARTRLRCILVNGVNAVRPHYEALADIASRLKNCDGIEFIPYHAYGGAKAEFIGREDNGNKAWIPDPQQIKAAKETVKSFGQKVI